MERDRMGDHELDGVRLMGTILCGKFTGRGASQVRIVRHGHWLPMIREQVVRLVLEDRFVVRGPLYYKASHSAVIAYYRCRS